MSGQFPPKKLSVAILSRLCYLQRRLTGLFGRGHLSCCYDGLADGSTLAAVVKSHVRYPVGPADTDDLAKMAAVVGINANQVGLC